MDRARAAARKTPFLPMFLYTPPQVLFTPAEKELLRAALNGAPDEVISERLGIPVSAVKGRWHRIHQRAADRIPELFQQTPALVGDGYRGRQIRHVILEYVRDNPSELTPYARLPRFRPQRRG